MKHTVSEHKLSSGAQGLLIDVPGASVTSILVRFNSGYQFGDQSKYEIPHIMEHLLATVSQKYHTPNGFVIAAQKNGAMANANTSATYNGYVFECADFERGRILDLLEEQLVRPLFSEAAFAAEVGNVREELSRNTTEYGRVCNLRLAAAAYDGQYLDFPTRIEQLETISLADLQAHYKRTHTAANARFFVAGDLSGEAEALVERFERLFGALPVGERLQPSPQIGHHLERPLVQHEAIKQLYYSFDAYFGEVAPADRPAATMLRLVLAGGMGSLIYGEARQRGLAYGVGAGVGMGVGNSSFGFYGHVTPSNASDLFEVIGRHWRDVSVGTLATERIEAAKALGIGSTRRANQTVGDMAGWYIGSYDSLGVVLDFDDYMKRLEAVEKADIIALVKQINDAERSGLSVLGEIDNATAEQLLSIIRQ